MAEKVERWIRQVLKFGILSAVGLIALCVAAWQVHPTLGIVAIGLTFLILDWLREDKE